MAIRLGLVAVLKTGVGASRLGAHGSRAGGHGSGSVGGGTLGASSGLDVTRTAVGVVTQASSVLGSTSRSVVVEVALALALGCVAGLETGVGAGLGGHGCSAGMGGSTLGAGGGLNVASIDIWVVPDTAGILGSASSHVGVRLALAVKLGLVAGVNADVGEGGGGGRRQRPGDQGRKSTSC